MGDGSTLKKPPGAFLPCTCMSNHVISSTRLEMPTVFLLTESRTALGLVICLLGGDVNGPNYGTLVTSRQYASGWMGLSLDHNHWQPKSSIDM